MGILPSDDAQEVAPETQRAFQTVAHVGVVARLLSAIDVNAMTVTDEELRPVALGLYPRAVGRPRRQNPIGCQAVFNHDEAPNVVQSFVGRRLLLRSCRVVPQAP